MSIAINLTAQEIREKYLRFFEKRGHTIIPSAPLIPENDPTVLFTTAGMHPLVPYLLGERHPLGNRLCSAQKCIRTNDIDEVGDATHLTFFEMLGNWSLGDPNTPDGVGPRSYFKKEAIEWSYEFLTKELGIPLEKLAVSVFAGEPENNIPRDDEAAEIWQGLGIAQERIAYLGREDNWWGPAGLTGPCGPDTEMFYWSGTGSDPVPKVFEPSDKRWVEIWNDVFMQYNKKLKVKSDASLKLKVEEEYEFVPLQQKNVDTGMGLERVTAILQGKDSVYETELFEPIIEKIEELKVKSALNEPGAHRANREKLKVEDDLSSQDLANGSKLLIAIQDTGIGMTPEETKNVFGRQFERGQAAKKVYTLGRGIGLYIAANIVKAHQGRTWAESEGPGKGSTFFVELPVVKK